MQHSTLITTIKALLESQGLGEINKTAITNAFHIKTYPGKKLLNSDTITAIIVNACWDKATFMEIDRDLQYAISQLQRAKDALRPLALIAYDVEGLDLLSNE